MHPLMPTLNTVATLPRTPTLPAVATLPATATLPAVAALPAPATLPAVATLPATATLPAVPALPATATLLAVATLPATATVCWVLVLSTVGLDRVPSLRVASLLRRPFDGRKDAMWARGEGFFCTGRVSRKDDILASLPRYSRAPGSNLGGSVASASRLRNRPVLTEVLGK
jgi:hypothetical protein